MEVNKFVDIGGRLFFRPTERYEFGWSDWRTLYTAQRQPDKQDALVRPADERDLIDQAVDAIVDSLVWCVDQLLRVVS